MNLAIVIGISNYENFNKLQQCKNDSDTMFNVLKKSKKYDEILKINKRTETRAWQIKDSIDRFLLKYKGQEINEIFFYFSGHGITKNDEFYYCTTNTNEEKLMDTSLVNSQIDQAIRNYKPKVFAKIIDACESGKMYIKGQQTRSEVLTLPDDAFKACYFISSSQRNQNSYVQEKFSEFTFAIFKIIKDRFNDELYDLKFRDLSNCIADYFSSNSEQTPLIIQQGTLTDNFISINSDIYDALSNIENCIANNVEEEYPIIKDVIDEELAISFKNNFLSKMFTQLKKDYNNFDTIKNCSYEITNESIETSIIKRDKVCNWLKENKNKYFIFANVVATKHYNRKNTFDLFNQNFDYIEDDFSVNVDKENYCKSFDAISSHNAYPKLRCEFNFLYSLNKLYVIYTFGISVPESWTKYTSYKADKDIQIKVIKFTAKSQEINNFVKELSNEFLNYIDDYISNYIDALL